MKNKFLKVVTGSSVWLLIFLSGAVSAIIINSIGLWHSAPRVTLMNVTGETITQVKISLGEASHVIAELKNGYFKTVYVRGSFSETSTQVEWSDSTGIHSASAGDYMENYAGYHSEVVLTADKKATAIYQMVEPKIKSINR